MPLGAALLLAMLSLRPSKSCAAGLANHFPPPHTSPNKPSAINHFDVLGSVGRVAGRVIYEAPTALLCQSLSTSAVARHDQSPGPGSEAVTVPEQPRITAWVV